MSWQARLHSIVNLNSYQKNPWNWMLSGTVMGIKQEERHIESECQFPWIYGCHSLHWTLSFLNLPEFTHEIY